MYLTNLTQYLEDTARACPDRAAIIENGQTITFADLRARALDEAVAISKALQGRKKQAIAVCLPKSIDLIVADMAALYSGNAFMNLDVKAPLARGQAILEKTNPALLIGGKDIFGMGGKFHAIGAAPHAEEGDAQRLFKILSTVIDTDLCCLINTSGSTGVPKTVALCHRNYIDYTESVIKAGLIGGRQIAGSLAPPIFDHFNFELCLMMATGCSLALIPEGMAAFPARLLEYLASLKASFIFWVPTIMVNIANMDLLAKIPLPDIKTIWFAGEVFHTSRFNYWREHLKEAKFVNLYGPTEITVDCLYYVADNIIDCHKPMPIGGPLPNTSILVLDADNREITREDTETRGELCVRGSSLALGYYNDPEQTAKAFVQNPLNNSYPEKIYRTGDFVKWDENGQLIYCGRADAMIKHSGYRIELGEIEHAAFKAGYGIRNAYAMYDGEKGKIVLFYEAGEKLAEKDLRSALSHFLPRYMIPHVYIFIENMPMNVNGKIDRKWLQSEYANSKGKKDNA